MDWMERLNQAIAYIESHLTEDLNYEAAAKIACCSTYHFQRMFSSMSGVSLAEYIRRRRITLAAKDLQTESISSYQLPNYNKRSCSNEIQD